MKEAAKEAFENNLGHYETLKTISRGYLSKLESSVQEAGHIFLDLKLERVFLAVHFVNTYVLEERTQELLFKKETQ